jgi:Flp pilus assembly protein TadB
MDASKLKLPMVVVAGLLSAVATGAGTWAVASDRLTRTSERVERVETRQDEASKEAEAQRLRTQRVEDALVNVAETLREVRSDVKDILKRR